MRYFFDTEFHDFGKCIEMISIGVVAEDGREFYRENAAYDLSQAHEWLQKNVIPLLDGGDLRKSPEEIKTDLLDFIGEDDDPQFWAYFASHDWMMLCSLFGGMINLPKTWPMFTRDVQTVRMQLGGIRLPVQRTVPHHALNDAKWTLEAFDCLKEYATMGRLEDLLFR